MKKIHNFRESLAKSHAAENLPWESIYRQAFPRFQALVNHRDDGPHQRAGIDRSVILDNSKQILVDEKVRFTDYDDIALEYLSNDRTGALGWVCKPLFMCDYIAYMIAPLGRGYLLPVEQLQAAYSRYGVEWRGKYYIAKARNPNYTTLSVCVPANVLFKAIGECLRVSFKPIISKDQGL